MDENESRTCRLSRVFLPQPSFNRSYPQRVVDAFAASPAVGVVALDSMMLGMPHLKQARRVLGMAKRP